MDKSQNHSLLRALFVMEQPLGNRTYYLNLRHYIETMPLVEATWVEVSYHSESPWERLSFLPVHIRSSLIGRAQVLRGLRESSSQVVLFHTQSSAALAGGLISKNPYIISTDMTPIQNEKAYSQFDYRPLYVRILKRIKHHQYYKLYFKSRRIISWTSWARSSLISDYAVDANKIDVVPPGIDLKEWRPVHKPHNGPLRILFVGADFYRKGGEILLDAFRMLPRGMTELVLVTQTFIQPQPGVITYQNIKPNSPELMTLYQNCDVFVMPSKAEAFGIAAVEACASGLPVIATSVGGLSEIVIHNETGMLIPLDDKQALIKNISLLAGNSSLRKQMGQAGRAYVETHFDGKKNANRLVEILEKAINQ